MFSSTSYPSNNPGSYQSQDHGRPSLSHSHSQPFAVAGMSNTGVSHSPSLRSGPLAGSSNYGMGGPLGDSLSQSRSHYQPGYLMVRLDRILNQTVLNSFSVCNAEPCTSHVLYALIFRSHYPALQATSQSPRSDETPIVPTKAKISSVLAGGSAADFGMDSMFQSTR